MINKERLEKLMLDYNCTKKQLAEYLQITTRSLYDKINGKTEFTLKEIQLMYLMFPKNEVIKFVKGE